MKLLQPAFWTRVLLTPLSGSTELWQASFRPYATSSTYVGLIQGGVEAFGEIRHALSDRTGSPDVATWGFVYFDRDGYWRAKLADSSFRFLTGQEVTCLFVSTSALTTEASQPNSMFRGHLAEPTPGPRRRFSFRATSRVGTGKGPVDLDSAVNKRKYDPNDWGIDNLPREAAEKTVPALWGELSDEGVTNADGDVIAQGMVIPQFCGRVPTSTAVARLLLPTDLQATINGSGGTPYEDGATIGVTFLSANGETTATTLFVANYPKFPGIDGAPTVTWTWTDPNDSGDVVKWRTFIEEGATDRPRYQLDSGTTGTTYTDDGTDSHHDITYPAPPLVNTATLESDVSVRNEGEVLPLDPSIATAVNVFANDLNTPGEGTLSGRVFALVTAIQDGKESPVSGLAGTIDFDRAVRVNWDQADADPAITYRIYFFDATGFTPQGGPGNATKVRYLTHDNTTFDGDPVGPAESDFSIDFRHWTDGTDYLATDKDYDFFCLLRHTGKITKLYASDLRTGSYQAVSDDEIGTGNYFDFGSDNTGVTLVLNGHTYWGFKARGPKAEAHKNGSFPFRANICGWHEDNDLDEPIIDQAALAYQDVHIQMTGGPEGRGYEAGDRLSVPSYTSYPTVPILKTSRFQAVQDLTKLFLSDDKGYVCCIYLDDDTTWREFIETMHASFGFDWAEDENGQIIIALMDDTQSPDDGTLLRERIEIAEVLDAGGVVDQEIQNIERYEYIWHPIDQVYKSGVQEITNDVSIGSVYGERWPGHVTGKKYTHHRPTADDSSARLIADRAFGPTYPAVVCKFQRTLPISLGTQYRIQHSDFITDVAFPAYLTERRINISGGTITLKGRDRRGTYVLPAAPDATTGTSFSDATDEELATYAFATDDNGLNPDGSLGSRAR